jgi:hypothetical protein
MIDVETMVGGDIFTLNPSDAATRLFIRICEARRVSPEEKLAQLLQSWTGDIDRLLFQYYKMPGEFTASEKEALFAEAGRLRKDLRKYLKAK